MGQNISQVEVREKRKSSSTDSVQLPSSYEAIVKEADSTLDNSRIKEQLRASGIFLNNKKKKYWLDENDNNCFMVFAKDLSITWGSDSRYWCWLQDTSNDNVEVAELLNVCWLEVRGKFDIAKLTPGIKYEVVFMVKMKDDAYGWETPVKLRLNVPGGNESQERKENLQDKAKVNWTDIPLGEFTTSPAKKGEIEFSLFEYGGEWKSGLVIKAVKIWPKKT